MFSLGIAAAQRIVTAIRDGESPEAVANREKVTVGLVRIYARAARVRLSCGDMMGRDRTPSTYEIIAGLLKGESVESLAERFRVPRQRIKRIQEMSRNAGILHG